MTPFLALVLVLQQHPVRDNAYTTPPSGDTLGYWQQSVDYRIVATLDEARGVVKGVGDMLYVNQSPDTLVEMYFHQHLNAFRPASAWSRADAREGRVRFQNLRDPDYGYERFTSAPTIDGVAVTPHYPGAPDSTVVRFALPRPLPPGGSVRLHFEWDARPSTLPRRQGRRGRSFDLAQWYPRVAVYDRGGWEPNPLVPSGEFYGEFGTYDVTLVLPGDQVIGATGVPVEGDPGWQRALRWGSVHPMRNAYARVREAPAASVPAGFKRVRFVAENVHHFAWSTSPDYRYEGGAYLREGRARARFPVWDTVAVHVLYQPGDTATWGKGIAVERTINALRWLEHVYGPYGYPQMTNLHRIEGGGTEFPMMMMNGSASQGLILHEGGHIFTHGILANNEWRSGWLDEGLTSYQTSWAAGATPQDRPAQPPQPAAPRVGYRSRAVRIDPAFGGSLDQQRLVHVGRAEPLGTRANEFNEFAIYNGAVYTRAEIMYGALREVLGDSAFSAFLHDYYSRWAFKHVDELAMRASAERVSGKSLGWFFDQWVRRAGNLDYAISDVKSELRGDGQWRTSAIVEKRGEYVHPMPVGVRTSAGWTVVRDTVNAGAITATGISSGGAPAMRSPVNESDTDTIVVMTSAEPREVRLDPYLTTYDWDRRNDALPGPFATAGSRQVVFDWPLLEQASADRQVIAWMPWAMRSDPGGVAVGLRVRSNYQGWIDRTEAGIATSIGQADRGPAADPGAWRNLWFSLENPTLRRGRPLNGVKLAAWNVDDAVRVDLSKSWDISPFIVGPRATRTVGISAIAINGLTYLDPAQWENEDTYELFGRQDYFVSRPASTVRVRVTGYAGGAQDGAYARSELELSRRALSANGLWALALRGFSGAATSNAPRQRQYRLSAQDPGMTFGNHFLRPAGSPLGRPGTHYTPLGGGGLRGYDPRVAATGIASVNAEVSRRLAAPTIAGSPVGLWLGLFADAGYADLDEQENEILVDAGVGLSARGMLFDRPIAVRFDLPLHVSHERLAIDARADERATRFRWTFSFTDLW